MLSALSKFVPRAFSKKSNKPQQSDVQDEFAKTGGASVAAKSFTCRVILLDDTELTLNVKVSSSIKC